MAVQQLLSCLEFKIYNSITQVFSKFTNKWHSAPLQSVALNGHLNSSSTVTYTVFARSNAVATTYFIAQFCVASIREWLLIESGVY